MAALTWRLLSEAPIFVGYGRLLGVSARRCCCYLNCLFLLQNSLRASRAALGGGEILLCSILVVFWVVEPWAVTKAQIVGP